MPRPALTDEQRKEIRHNIRDAAAKLYSENGVNNISVRAVAARAGVSVGTVYSYFGSLSELLQSLWRQPARKLVQQMTQLGHQIQDPVERLSALLTAYVHFSVTEPQVFRSAFLFVRPSSVPPPEQMPLESDEFFNLFCDAITEGQSVGAIRPGEPDVLTQIVLSAVHGSLALPINWHRLALIEGPSIAEQVIAAQVEWLVEDR